jgi:hypothetical protein
VTERTKEHASGAGGTNARAAAWLVWSLAALSVAMFVAASVLSVLAQSAQSQDQSTLVGAISETVGFVLFLAFPIVGALVAARRPQNPIGWIRLADGLLWMLLAVTDSYNLYGVSSPGSVPFPVTVGALGNIWLWVPTVGLLGTYLLLLFPDGKLPSKRWRPLAVFSGVVIVLFSVAEGLAPGLLENQGGVQNRSGSRRSPDWWVRRTSSSRCYPFASLLRR